MTVTGRGVNRARVAEIGAREEAEYRRRTPRSAELFERARHALPLGVASSFQAYDPYPLFMTDARGSRITDADGNEYIDFDMAFGVLAAGHADGVHRRLGARVAEPHEVGVEAGLDLLGQGDAVLDRERVARAVGDALGQDLREDRV